MKKRSYIIAGILLLVVLLAAAAVFVWKNPISAENQISKIPGIDVKNAIEISYEDSHGGFHGDGMTFAVYDFSEASLTEQLSDNGEWKELPLSENLTAIVYGSKKETGTEAVVRGSYITDEEHVPLIPEIDKGYYFFLDKQAERAKQHEDEDIFHRASYNFIIAIYDTDIDRLYYAECDS